MKVNILLSALTRKCKRMTIEVPDDFNSWDENSKKEVLRDIYEQDIKLLGWKEDTDWGVEEGTHSVLAEARANASTSFVVDEFKNVKESEVSGSDIEFLKEFLNID